MEMKQLLCIAVLCGLMGITLAVEPKHKEEVGKVEERIGHAGRVVRSADTTETCHPENHYKCDNESATCPCMNIHTLCDGIQDCEYGEDEGEAFCIRKCEQHYGYWCEKHSRCIHRTEVCDTSKAYGRKSEKTRVCRNVDCGEEIEGYMRCDGSQQCVRISDVCAAARGSRDSPCINEWVPGAFDEICLTDAATTTYAPTPAPTDAPTPAPTDAPTPAPTDAPTPAPTDAPTPAPTDAPTPAPTDAPTPAPTDAPTPAPTDAPTTAPQGRASVNVVCSGNAPDATYSGPATPLREVGDYRGGVSVCEAALYAHNMVRLNHENTVQLVYSDSLAESAEAWAIYMANNDHFEHSTGRSNVGENLYYGSSNGISVTYSLADAVFGWYDEMNTGSYNFATGTGNDVIGHFTQVVWTDSTEVGCGVSRVERVNERNQLWEYTYVACQYAPAGNVNVPSGSVQHVTALRPDAIIPEGPRELEPQDGGCILQAPNCGSFSSLCDNPNYQWVADACSDICYPECQ